MEGSEQRFRQKKSMSQVFLRQEWPGVKIAEHLKDLRIDHVIEIGPGTGILTRQLLLSGFYVTALEKDEYLAANLPAIVPATLDSHRLTVVAGDCLKFDLEGFLARHQGQRVALVGNIPYHISSPILFWSLPHIGPLKVSLFMTQLEFAQRLAAKHNSKDYGSLTVFAQLRSRVELLFKVERHCFHPVPKVDSAVVALTPLPREDLISAEELARVERISRQVFTQRRKKLRNALGHFMDEMKGVDAFPLSLDRRPETLSPQEFLDLTRFIFKHISA